MLRPARVTRDAGVGELVHVGGGELGVSRAGGEREPLRLLVKLAVEREERLGAAHSNARYCLCLASIIATIGLGSAGCQLL